MEVWDEYSSGQPVFIILPTYAQRSSIKLVLNLLRHVSVLIPHSQGSLQIMWAKVMNYGMIKYNIVVCRYGKILVNVAAYVILQWIV